MLINLTCTFSTGMAVGDVAHLPAVALEAELTQGFFIEFRDSRGILWDCWDLEEGSDAEFHTQNNKGIDEHKH